MGNCNSSSNDKVVEFQQDGDSSVGGHVDAEEEDGGPKKPKKKVTYLLRVKSAESDSSDQVSIGLCDQVLLVIWSRHHWTVIFLVIWS